MKVYHWSALYGGALTLTLTQTESECQRLHGNPRCHRTSSDFVLPSDGIYRQQTLILAPTSLTTTGCWSQQLRYWRSHHRWDTLHNETHRQRCVCSGIRVVPARQTTSSWSRRRRLRPGQPTLSRLVQASRRSELWTAMGSCWECHSRCPLPPPRASYTNHSLLNYIESCTDELSQEVPAAPIVFAGNFKQIVDRDVEERTGLQQHVHEPTQGPNLLHWIFISSQM